MYHTKIVKEVLDSPGDFTEGISGVVLDDTHTLVLASDHNDANPSITKDELDAFVSGYETVSSHSQAGYVKAQMLSQDGTVLDSHNL